MEKEFVAMLKFADTRIGDQIEDANGELIKILHINRIEAINKECILIYGIGEAREAILN